MKEILILIFRQLFGLNYKPVPVEPIAMPIPVTNPPSPEETITEPIEPVTKAAPAPNIVIPKPENADNHGPASAIARALIRKGHVIFEKDTNPYNLNIVGIRSSDREFDVFNDRIAHFYKHQGEWKLSSWTITTDPGKTYMVDRLLSSKGCAILAPGQYRDVYKLDLHRGVYQALCQRNGSVRVYRDKNRDRIYDLNPATIETGSFGINIHATESPDDGISVPLLLKIGPHSAGCQVFARVNDFVDAREQWRMSRTLWGDNFTYTLIDEADVDDLGETPLEPINPQVSDKEEWTPVAPATVGTRNRNLLNVKQGSDPWKYSTGKDGKGHAIFPNYASGIRAAIITLRTYWKTHRLRSLNAIISRWAPSSDTIGSVAGAAQNNPSAYAAFLAKQTGYPAGSTLMLFNDDGTVRSADQLFAVISAMVIYENHHGVKLPRSVFDAGLKLV